MNNKELKQQYRTWLNEILELINEWDPYSLVSKHDFPKDEYMYEAKLLFAGLSKCESQKDVTMLISKIYTEAFHDGFTPEICDDFGIKIWNWWKTKSS